ncbi:MAG TPA: NAD(P)H-binding protein [Candidatus Methylacidiphilales bacterium]|nr:NAD(P)H-binding protein [Candidatus Methylacidiphilales bacterium]
MILVTGGTGFVGQEVVAELLRLGQRVRLLVRDPEKAARLSLARQVELVQGDVLKPGTLPAALAGVKAVIHLVGFILETPRISYEQGHFEATRNVLLAAQQAGVTRWIQMSAAGTRPYARSRYHLTKWRAEELVRQSGLDWTIFRPSLIYGYDERDRLLNLLKRVLTFPADLAQLDSLPLIDGGRPLVQPVSVKEVARCFAAAPTQPAAIGRTFDLVGPLAFPWREMVLKILAALGRKGVCEEFPILLLLRMLLWLATLFLGVMSAYFLAVAHGDRFSLFLAAVAGLLFVPLVIGCVCWRTIIIFNLPGELVIAASEVLNYIAPQGLRPSEALKMSVEDNTGDPHPAEEVFGFKAEPFEEGVRRIVG